VPRSQSPRVKIGQQQPRQLQTTLVDDSHLPAIRDRIIEIIDTGTTAERKALCETLLDELGTDASLAATPVLRVPHGWADTPSLLNWRREPPTARRFAPVDLKWTVGYSIRTATPRS
jgi:hypothetical protein